jgi:redox-sensitive bicupin YhaK (pirin superfamily)
MISIRKSNDRGHANHGWLDSRHTFSFASYHNPQEMGFGALRVINEDRVAPGQGFGTHPHRDMEIISYVIDGALEHRDSMGTGSVIRPGDVQSMSAGTGVAHSEFNASREAPVHFLQIWIEPAVRGVTPSYQQKTYTSDDKRGRLRLVASPDGADDSVRIHQDARVYAALLDADEEVKLPLAVERRAYVQVVRGDVELNGQKLGQGDGAKVLSEPYLALTNGKDAEVLVFDLP